MTLLELPFPRIDPVLLDLPGPLDLRWYGLGYVVAFVAGAALVRRLCRDGFLAMTPEQVGDLVFAMVLGVIIGGRLGYILFYESERFAADPLRLVRVWEGGLSFHGGLIGSAVALWIFSRGRTVSWLRLGDAISLAATPGIFAVRLANFVNGELYGRVADPSIPWAMRFPTDPVALRLMGGGPGGLRETEATIRAGYATGRWEAIHPQVPLRHPSQLYEALGEGVLLGIILWMLYHHWSRRGTQPAPGAFAGLFLVGYGAVRSVVELFRQPDAQFRDAGDALGTVLGPLTMGQLLSLSMVLVGTGLLVRAARRPAATG